MHTTNLSMTGTSIFKFFSGRQSAIAARMLLLAMEWNQKFMRTHYFSITQLTTLEKNMLQKYNATFRWRGMQEEEPHMLLQSFFQPLSLPVIKIPRRPSAQNYVISITADKRLLYL